MKPQEEDKNLSLLQKAQRSLSNLLMGVNQDDLDDVDAVQNGLRTTLQKVSNKYRTETGQDITGFFTKLSLNETPASKQDNAQSGKKAKININELIEGTDKNTANNIFYQERDRIMRYEHYRQVHDLIPQLAAALDVYTDNIISPDDFTKNSLNVDYQEGNEEETDQAKMKNRIKDLVAKYKLDSGMRNLIECTLRDGDRFIAVLDYSEEVKKLLNESTAPMTTERKKELEAKALSESEVAFTENQKDILNELDRALHLAEGGKADEFKEADESQFKKDLAEVLKETFVVSDEPEGLLEGYRAFDKEAKKDVEDINVNGSIVRNLDASKVVKLTSDDGICYGYYYIDYTTYEAFGKSHINSSNRFQEIMASQYNTGDNAASGINDAKMKLISKVFVANLSKQIDRKYVENNPEFREVIYSLLRTKRNEETKIKITFIPPEQVVHFGDIGDDGYGTSVYEKTLFTAKLYLASLTSTLIQKLVRAPEKRIFYIEQGLDEDIPGSINSFIKSIKSKEFKMADLDDIGTSIQSSGTFHDMYVPMSNGEKPIEVDTLPSQDVSVENDFLDYLRRTMISGMNVPASFIGYSDEVEFARSLTMQNGKLVRSVVSKQAMFQSRYKELIVLLYRNEYKAELEANEQEKEAKPTTKAQKKKANEKQKQEAKDKNQVVQQVLFNEEQLVVRFPRPITLLSSIISEQISTARDIGEFITNMMVGEDKTETDEYKMFMIEVVKDYLPGIEWDRYKDVLERINRDIKKGKILDGKDGTEENEDEFGGGF